MSAVERAGASDGRKTRWVVQARGHGVNRFEVAAAVACGMLLSACDREGPSEVAVVVNQAGYRPSDRKVALANGECGRFSVIDSARGVVFEGKATLRSARDPQSGDTVWEMDFSGIKTPGRYILRAVDSDRSAAFDVGDGVYADLHRKAARFFYYQRCGTALLEEFAGQWARPLCHQEEGLGGYAEVTFESGIDGRLDGRGGWHDAGDYNRYNPYHPYVAGILMLAYETFPDRFDDRQLNLPESGNGVPDVLDEVKWGLDWVLKMQRSDGGVYHSVHDEGWIGVRAADQDENIRYVIDTTTAEDAAQSAAAWAMAARLFAPFDDVYPGYAGACLRAAESSWGFLVEYPGDPEMVGGDRDCLFWAAVELFRATGGETYHDFIKQCEDARFNGEWASLYYCDVQLLAMYGYLRADGADAALQSVFLERILDLADGRKAVQESDGYTCSLTRYPWMSNAFALGDAVLWLVADAVTGGDSYRQCALDNLSYCLGRNCHGTCFVTGVGTRYPAFPFHQPSMADGIDEPVPGIMVGGPNEQRCGYFGTTFPAKAWADRSYYLGTDAQRDEKNYFYQEPSIAAAAPLVFVTAAFAPAADSGQGTP